MNLHCLLPTVCLDLFAARDFGNVNSVVAVGLGVAMDLVACRGCGCGFGCGMGGGRGCVALCAGFEQAFCVDVEVGFVFYFVALVSVFVDVCLISDLHYRIVNPLS